MEEQLSRELRCSNEEVELGRGKLQVLFSTTTNVGLLIRNAHVLNLCYLLVQSADHASKRPDIISLDFKRSLSRWVDLSNTFVITPLLQQRNEAIEASVSSYVMRFP